MLAFMFLAPTHPRTPVALVSALVMDFVYLINNSNMFWEDQGR